MYQVLARKYRPRNFNELVGQNHVSRALTSALERGRLHHAYLFTGTRGVGKTTIARILAKCLNCETGVTSTPCEVCPTCKAVNEGRFIDLIEIDAASRTKVEDTRELLDNVPYAPTQGRFKVYLIDEVHMLSMHSFNALLKTLEEPPDHVKFLFATTDPQKLPITVISRCLQFTLRPLAVDEITEHLSSILSKEQIQAEQDAIWQIAESAQGSLRDALSLTDQAIAYGQGEIHHQDVKDMLGLIDRTIIYDLIMAIHQNQTARVSALLMQFRQQALDVSLVLDQLISTLHELALLQYLPDLSLKYSAEINQKITQLSQRISAQDLQLYYQIASKGRADLQLAVTQEQGFEMCVLRLLAFRPLQPNEVPLTQAGAQGNVVAVAPAVESATAQPEPVHPVVSAEDELEAETAAINPPVAEPSSDDFLQDEAQEVAEVASPSEPDHPVTLSAEAASAQMIFDPAADELLFDLDEDDHADQPATQNEASSDDFLFDEIAPLPETAVAQPIQQSAEPAAPVSPPSAAQPELTHPQDSSPQDSLFAQSAPTPSANQPVVAAVDNTAIPRADQRLMPQDILQLPVQSLEGEWSVEKWEYWFRNSDLSPAVQELAQHGLMTGQIEAESVFHIPEQYQQLLNSQLQHLEAALKQQWPNSFLKVQYGQVTEVTPYSLQQERKVRAYQRASELLHQEPVVKSLLESFDGELQNIQLK